MTGLLWALAGWWLATRGKVAASAPVRPLSPPRRPAPRPARPSPPRVTPPASNASAAPVARPPTVIFSQPPRGSGAPAFPSPDWIPANPPSADIQARASALLPQLWTLGEGTSKTEQVGSEWITFQAVAMGDKRGVTAYRLRSSTPASAPPAGNSLASTASVSTSLPTLREGSRGGDVLVLQQRLGTTKPDGIFGPATKAAVISFQRNKGLVTDGIVAAKTWAMLFGGGTA